MRVSLVFDGVSAGWDRGGNPLPALGRIRLDIVIPVKWRNGPFRELKLWFVDQYDRQFHGGALAKTQRHSKMLAEKACHAREDTARVAKGMKPRKRRKNLTLAPTFNARDVNFIKKDGSGVFDVDTISRAIEDGDTLRMTLGGENEKKKKKPKPKVSAGVHVEGKGGLGEKEIGGREDDDDDNEEEDRYRPSRLCGAAAGSLNARRRQRALEKVELMDTLYDEHEAKALAEADTEGILLQRQAVAAAHRAYNVKLTELTALGLTHEVRAYLRDEACDRNAILNTRSEADEGAHSKEEGAAAAEAEAAETNRRRPEAGMMSDTRNATGDTPLALACMFGHTETVRELLLAGADPDMPCRADDWTPMVAAARCAHHEIVKLLIDAGANRSRNNVASSIWAGDHVIKHSWNATGRTTEDRVKTTALIRSYKMAESWIEVIDDHWNGVRDERRRQGIGHPHEKFHRLANAESLKNTKGLPPRYLPLQKASTLVRTRSLSRDQLERLRRVWKLVSTVRQEDDAPQDGVVEGEKDPIMTKARLLAALVDRRRNARIQRILTGGQSLAEISDQKEKGVDVEAGLPSLLVILQPFLWKEAFLQMDSRLGAGKVAFDEFVSFVLVSDSPSGAGRATLRQIFDTLDLESSDKFPRGRVPKALLLRAFSGTGSGGARGTRSAQGWAVRALRKLPSLSILLKPNSWRKMFPLKKEVKSTTSVSISDTGAGAVTEGAEEVGEVGEGKYTGDNGLSLREEALLKIRAQERRWQTLEGKQEEREQTETWGDGDMLQPTGVDDGCVSFGEFYDKCHLLASEVGKFVPVVDESIARDEAEVEIGEDVKARWRGSREFYNAKIIGGNAKLGYSVVYETGEYDTHVSSKMVLHKEEKLEELEMQEEGLMGDQTTLTAAERKLLKMLNKK